MAYSQNDPAWRNILLGFNTSNEWTIGTAGCYVTAIANVCRWAGNDLNPQQINDICKQNNWFVNGGEIARDDIPALLCSNLGFVGRTNWSGPTDINFFNDASDTNIAYIIEIDASSTPGIQTHFTMVWSKPDASDLEIDDSWDGVRKALSRYGLPSAIILSAMKFVKVAPPAPAAPLPPPPVAQPDPPQPAVQPSPPAAPVPVKLTENYTLITTLQYYGNSTDAHDDKNAIGTISAGKYIVYEKSGIYWNLTTDNMTNQNKWINTLYNVASATNVLDPPPMTQPTNVPSPAPAPDNVTALNWRGTIDLRYAGMYVFYNHNKAHDPVALKVDIIDLETAKVIKQPENGQYAQFSGKVKWDDNNWYGRLKDTSGAFKWYAVRIEDLVPYSSFYGTHTTLQEREILHTLTAMDKFELGLAKIKTIGSDVWDVIKPKGKNR